MFPVLSEEPGRGGQRAEPESLPWTKPNYGVQADGFQRPLRSRFQPRLTPSVRHEHGQAKFVHATYNPYK